LNKERTKEDHLLLHFSTIPAPEPSLAETPSKYNFHTAFPEESVLFTNLSMEVDESISSLSSNKM